MYPIEIFSSRDFLIFLSLSVFVLYIPLNRIIKEGRHLKHRWDDHVPLVPFFVFPYLFFYFPWIVWFYGSLYYRPLIEVQQATFATVISGIIGYSVFIFFPTYVDQHKVANDSWAGWFLERVYMHDRRVNAFPSMHVTVTIMLLLFTWQRSVVMGMIFLPVGGAIIVSTVLTKQHYLYDIAGGFFLGVFSFFISHQMIFA